MAKFYGQIGFSETKETAPGVYEKVVIERPAFGDLLSNSRGLGTDDKVNRDLTLTNSISIIADAFVMSHYFAIEYVTFQGARWVVSTVEVKAPRLIIRLGEVYNGPTPETP